MPTRGTRGAPIMPRDAVSRTANVERTGRHKWVNSKRNFSMQDLEWCLNFLKIGSLSIFYIFETGKNSEVFGNSSFKYA